MSTINAQRTTPFPLPTCPHVAASWSCITFKRSKAILQCRESSRALKVLLQPTAFAPKWPRPPVWQTLTFARYVFAIFFLALTKEIRKKSEKFRVKKSKLVLETITQTSRFFLETRCWWVFGAAPRLENSADLCFLFPSESTNSYVKLEILFNSCFWFP